ncbi:MAG: glycosyltransferase family 4 protein [Rhodovibrionaceae bacterium]
MRILHLSTSDIRGGAARGSYFLHRKLREQGIDSRMLVGRKYGDDPMVTELRGALAPFSERLRARLDQLPLRRYDKTGESFWSVGWQRRPLAAAIEAIAPDVLHLQWTGGGFLPVEALRGVRLPIVWTLRDMWAFTGGCHYTAGCEGYVTGCGRCPQLRSDSEADLSQAMVRRKAKAWPELDLRLVPISGWIAEQARRSRLLRDTPARVIPNGIDTTLFQPADKRKARIALGLPEKGQFILFTALNALDDERKGFWQLAEALAQLKGAESSDPPQLLVAGDMNPAQAPELPIPLHCLGRIDDDERLAALYAAADVVAAPSLQEAFGKVHIEAMACATPVVAFDSGGPGEIVEHGKTGYLAQAFAPEDLARGIDWCLQSVVRSPELGQAARARAARLYDIGVVAEQYIDHYATLLGADYDRSAA